MLIMEYSHIGKSFLQVKPFQCSHCGKKHYNLNIDKHLHGCVDQESKKNKNGESRLKGTCKHCDYNPPTLDLFAIHMINHLDKVRFECCGVFQCCYCDMSSSNEEDLQNHMISVPWEDQPIVLNNNSFILSQSDIEKFNLSSISNSDMVVQIEGDIDIKEEPFDFTKLKEEHLDNVEIKEEQMDIFVETGIIENSTNDLPNEVYIPQESYGHANFQESNLKHYLQLPQDTVHPNSKGKKRIPEQLTMQTESRKNIVDTKYAKHVYLCTSCFKIFILRRHFQEHFIKDSNYNQCKPAYVRKEACLRKNMYLCTQCLELFSDLSSFSKHDHTDFESLLYKEPEDVLMAIKHYNTLRRKPAFLSNEFQSSTSNITHETWLNKDNDYSRQLDNYYSDTYDVVIELKSPNDNLDKDGINKQMNSKSSKAIPNRKPNSFHKELVLDKNEIQTHFKSSETDKNTNLNQYMPVSVRRPFVARYECDQCEETFSEWKLFSKHKETCDTTKKGSYDHFGMDYIKRPKNSNSSNIISFSKPNSFHKELVLDMNERQIHFKGNEAVINANSNLNMPARITRPFSALFECDRCKETFSKWELFSKHKETCDASYETTARPINSIDQNYTIFRPYPKQIKPIENDNKIYPVSPSPNVEPNENILINEFNGSDTLSESGLFNTVIINKEIDLGEDQLHIYSKPNNDNNSMNRNEPIKSNNYSKPSNRNNLSELCNNLEVKVMNENDPIKSDYLSHYSKTFKQNTEAFMHYNLNNEDVKRGAKMVHQNIKHYNYELDTHITDHQLYKLMMEKYTNVNSEHYIGTRKISSYHQVNKTWLKEQNEISIL